MVKQLKQIFWLFIAILLFACFAASVIVLGMLLMPVAMLVIFGLALREIICWRKKNTKVVPRPVSVQTSEEGKPVIRLRLALQKAVRFVFPPLRHRLPHLNIRYIRRNRMRLE